MRFYYRHICWRHIISVLCLLMVVFHASGEDVSRCGSCVPRVVVKTNLAHDALLVPDIGVEVEIVRRFSVSAEGVFAHWGTDVSPVCWRVAGGWLEMRWWFGGNVGERSLTGHHLGVYGNVAQYDFCIGGKGVQSISPAYGYGLSYGYSFRLTERLNLDLGVRAGYVESSCMKYRPECGELIADRRMRYRYWGPAGIEVTLVWWPGRGGHNNPDYNYEGVL